MKKKMISAVFATVASVASADVLLWHHFDERAPGETTLATDTLMNAASSDYGSGTAHSISEGTALGSDTEFMPKYAAAPYDELRDIILYDPVSGTVHTNRSSLSFRTEGTSSALKGGAVVIKDVEPLHLTNFTVECFVCTTGGTHNLIAPIVGMVPKTEFMNESWQIGALTNGKMFMRFSQQPSSTSGQGTSRIDDGKWHHVALVCTYDETADKSVYQMFVDYRLDFTREYTSGAPNYKYEDNDIYIGGYKNAGRKFNGMIDEVRVSNAALRSDQFLRRYSPFVDGDTLLYLPFDGTPNESPELPYVNYAVRGKGDSITVEYSSHSTTNAIFSEDVYSPTMRDNPLLPPSSTNSASLFLQTNGVVGTGVGLSLSTYQYTATNFTAELFFKAEGKMIWMGQNLNEYSQTLLKISADRSPIQLTFNQANPGKLMLVCHNGYGIDTFEWLNCGTFGENLDDGKWHHVAVVYNADSSTLSLYIDYMQMCNIPNVRLSGAAYSGLIGYGGSGLKQFFHGKIDSVRFTQRALSLDEFLSPTATVADIPDDVVFYAPFNGVPEAVTPTQIVMGDVESRGFEGCEEPVFTGEVKYPELCLDGKEGKHSVTNSGSVRVNGSQMCFKNVKGVGIFDHTTEFYGRLSSVGSMAGLIRINNGINVPNGAPLWALYAKSGYLCLRCSTVTNGVSSTERYMDTTIHLNDFVDGEWHHFAMTTRHDEESDRQHFAIYIDGVEKWANSMSGYFFDRGWGFNVTMGYSIEEGGNVVGDFDEVKITRGVLPPSKFMCRYRRPRGTVVTVR